MAETALDLRVAERTHVAERNNAVTPLEMVDRALNAGASPETLEKLLALQERWEANQARRAFDEAIAAAKAEIPVIEKNRKGHNSKYADFAAIARVVDPIISKYGLNYRFRTRQDDRIHVTCILSHEAGHSEETTLSGPADNSGAKNAIQAIGSTLTYLQRYTLTQALGLAASDDDDGKAAGSGATISDDQLINLRELLEVSGADEKRFLAYWRLTALADMPAKEYDGAVAMLKKRMEKAHG